MRKEYEDVLTKFNPFEPLNQFGEPIVRAEDELPDLVKRLLIEIRKEKGLTYVSAYAALEITYKLLKRESNFVQLGER